MTLSLLFEAVRSCSIWIVMFIGQIYHICECAGGACFRDPGHASKSDPGGLYSGHRIGLCTMRIYLTTIYRTKRYEIGWSVMLIFCIHRGEFTKKNCSPTLSNIHFGEPINKLTPWFVKILVLETKKCTESMVSQKIFVSVNSLLQWKLSSLLNLIILVGNKLATLLQKRNLCTKHR